MEQFNLRSNRSISWSFGALMTLLCCASLVSAQTGNAPNYGIEVYEGVRKVTPKPAGATSTEKTRPKPLLIPTEQAAPIDLKPSSVQAAPAVNVWVNVPPIKVDLPEKTITPATHRVEPEPMPQSITQPTTVVLASDAVPNKSGFPNWLSSLLGTMGALVGFYVLLVMANLVAIKRGGSPLWMMPGQWNMLPAQPIMQSTPATAEPAPEAKKVERDPNYEPFGELGIPKGPGVIFVDPWEVPAPNFELGKTFEEEREEKLRQEEQRAEALLTHIFQQNRTLLAKLETIAQPVVAPTTEESHPGVEKSAEEM